MGIKKYGPWVIFFITAAVLYGMWQQSESRTPIREISYSELIIKIEEKGIHDVTIIGNEVSGHYKDNNRQFTTYVPVLSPLMQKLDENKVSVTAKPSGESNFWTNILINLSPIILFFAIYIWLTRRSGRGGMGGAMSIGKSKARLMTEEDVKVTFEDVAGVDEAKEDLQEVVEFLQAPEKFHRLGGKIPKGVLMVGPPGTGKTLLAKAVAGEAGVPFFSISGSDFVEMFVGVGASRVRDMFEQAKKNSPCIIFIDEIDAVGRNRGSNVGGNDERDQTLNAMLVEMDGFNDNEGIIIIAATNRVDVLDPALLRPGRFDRQITVSNPDITGREKILKVHSRKVPLGADVDLKVVARGTPGFSGADLANLINEAALLAARRSKRIVTKQEFEDSRDKILMGAERRTLVMSEEEKKMTAYHEGGHALVSLNMPGSTPIHKATIIPRGRALGMVQSLPERDQVSQTYEQMIAMLAMAMGGRVAEELIFGQNKVSSGAMGDIQQATNLAKTMVTQMGFSKKLGNVSYSDNNQYFPGGLIAEDTKKIIDDEVKRFVQEGYLAAQSILLKNRKKLDILANALIEYETLSGEEIRDVLDGKIPIRD
jgi:cell division protease FtsH